ncbi:MAG: hypothetical protein V4631_13435 [Pseudomonadota bacterium]
MKNGLQPSECDIVMEGGITSGVVYPSFIARLSKQFKFRSIGGASVGAVAAVAAAAAQWRRNRDSASQPAGPAYDPFAELAKLGKWLAKTHEGKSNLFALFQPCADLERHFACLVTSLNAPGPGGTLWRFVLAVAMHFPLGWLVGAAVVAGTIYATPPTAFWLRTGAVLLGVLCVVVVSIAHFALSGWFGLRANRFGICSGMQAGANQPPALTEWLHGYVQTLAGLPLDEPLHFDQLEASDIELVLMTTGVSEFRAHRLPYSGDSLAFRKSELAHYFPPSVIDWLIAHPSEKHRTSTRELLARMNADCPEGDPDVFFMPDPPDLPVIVAARMSLSFPILLQAVPLLRIRYYEDAVKEKGDRGMKTVWFSDGGLTNNFPIHLFDRLLPLRPTFGVVLDNSLRDELDAEGRIQLPDNNSAPPEGYADIGSPDSAPSVGGFFAAIVQTVRTWRHEALKRTSGFRDRVVLIRHTRKEGGLNLNMPPQSIERMARSGERAAEIIIARFHHERRRENGWINHRFVRMRTAVAMLHDALKPVHMAMRDKDEPTYAELWNARGEDLLTAYKLNPLQQQKGLAFIEKLAAAYEETDIENFNEGAPKNMPSLEGTPKET